MRYEFGLDNIALNSKWLFLMHWMSVKLPDNFQMREHSWPCRFHINNNNNKKKRIKNNKSPNVVWET
jgi:hypothetical protein